MIFVLNNLDFSRGPGSSRTPTSGLNQSRIVPKKLKPQKFKSESEPKVNESDLSPWEKIRLDNINECRNKMLELGLIKSESLKVPYKRSKKVLFSTVSVRKSERLQLSYNK